MSDDDKKDLLKMIPGGNNPDAVKNYVRALQGWLNNTTDFEELFRLKAQLRKMQYDAHIKAGFQPEEALKIVSNLQVWE